MEVFEMIEQVIAIIADYKGIPSDSITVHTSLVDELGLSSFDVIMLAGRFEDAFDIEVPDRKIRSLRKISDIVALIEAEV